MVEFRIIPYGLGFHVQSRQLDGADAGKVWRVCSIGQPSFETEAEAEEFIDGWLKELEYRKDWEGKVEKFAKDHPPRIYP